MTLSVLSHRGRSLVFYGDHEQWLRRLNAAARSAAGGWLVELSRWDHDEQQWVHVDGPGSSSDRRPQQRLWSAVPRSARFVLVLAAPTIFLLTYFVPGLPDSPQGTHTHDLGVAVTDTIIGLIVLAGFMALQARQLR